MRSELPRRAEVVVIGGGVIGCSIAYHLAAAGVRDVLLLESGRLGEGSTCKAAGGVRASFSDPVNIAMGARGLEVYSKFAALYEHDADFTRNGYLYCLSDGDSLREFADSVELQNRMGVPSRIVDAAEAQRLSPLIDTTHMVGAVWSPSDGRATPDSIVAGYSRAAQRQGATLATHCRVTDVHVNAQSVTGVSTTRGHVETRTVVCAAGAWSRAIGEMVGVDLPVTPYRRVIAFTQPVPETTRSFPLTVDFSSSFYFHPEGRGLALGWSDPEEAPSFDTSVRLHEWLERLAPYAERCAPHVLSYGVTSAWAGLYEVTPDNNQIIGRSCDVEGFLYATGFSGHGFLMAPATGEVIRDLYLQREPGYDISGLDVRRYEGTTPLTRERNII